MGAHRDFQRAAIVRGLCAIGQGKAELPANIWDMRPEDFPLPRDHSGMHKGDFPEGHEVFRTKMDFFGQIQQLVSI